MGTPREHNSSTPLFTGDGTTQAPVYPVLPPDVVLARLEQIDSRLRQLEEQQLNRQQTTPNFQDCFAPDMTRVASKTSMSTVLREVNLKGTLIDRLRFLEGRIAHLGSQLEKGGIPAINIVRPETNERKRATRQQTSSLEAPLVRTRRNQGVKVVAAATEQKKKKTLEAKNVMEAAEKQVNNVCRDDKKRMERAKLYKKWLPVMC